jgi:hypothetical protein
MKVAAAASVRVAAGSSCSMGMAIATRSVTCHSVFAVTALSLPAQLDRASVGISFDYVWRADTMRDIAATSVRPAKGLVR